MKKYILTTIINSLSLKELMEAREDFEELDKTGLMKVGIVKQKIFNPTYQQNPSISFTAVRIAVYQKIIEKILEEPEIY